MSFPRYDEYKDSGVEWLGEVPTHWEVEQCRMFVTEKTAKNDEAKNENYLSLLANIGVIPYEEKGDIGNKKPEDLSKCKLVAKGDLVINSMNYGIGSYGLSALDGVCSPVYIVLRPQLGRVHMRFALRIFENRAFQRFAQSFGNGILEHRCAINWNTLKNLRVGLPSLTEQLEILNFLDRETAKIDDLVAEQQNLIALLKEKRQALISHAVTKGLNPDAPMKDSGVEWLGEVPAHWEIRKGGYIGVLFGSEAVPEDLVKDEGRLPFLKVSSLSADTLKIRQYDFFIDPSAANSYRPKNDFVVFPKRGAAIFINKVNVVEVSALLDPNLMGWEMLDGHNAYYFANVLKSRGLSELADVSTVPQINNKHISPEKFPVPPSGEQHEIVTFLDSELSRIDQLVTQAQQGVSLLEERRTALISAAVTGKIDVRKAIVHKEEDAA